MCLLNSSLNSMCLNCSVLGNGCKGTKLKVWTGCVYRKVDIKMVFRKHKMLSRLEQEGRINQIDEASKQIMDMLDGKEAVKNNFKALIYGEEEYMVRLNDGWYPVNKLDCE